MDDFEKASRLKLRFGTTYGELTVEQLWDLDLPTLDRIAKGVNQQLRSEEEDSFIPDYKSKKRPSHNELRLNILKHVIESKVKAAEDNKSKAEKQAQLSRLKDIAAEKSDAELAAKSYEEIQKQIAELESELVPAYRLN